MEGAFRDLAVREGFDVNRFGGVYSNGKAHSYTTKLKVAAAIALAHVKSSGEPANIRAISRQCKVSRTFATKIASELEECGRAIAPNENIRKDASDGGAGVRRPGRRGRGGPGGGRGGERGPRQAVDQQQRRRRRGDAGAGEGAAEEYHAQGVLVPWQSGQFDGVYKDIQRTEQRWEDEACRSLVKRFTGVFEHQRESTLTTVMGGRDLSYNQLQIISCRRNLNYLLENCAGLLLLVLVSSRTHPSIRVVPLRCM
jgi:hypothetical protein